MDQSKSEENPHRVLANETFRSLTLQLEAVQRRADEQNKRTTFTLAVFGLILFFLGALLWTSLTT